MSGLEKGYNRVLKEGSDLANDVRQAARGEKALHADPALRILGVWHHRITALQRVDGQYEYIFTVVGLFSRYVWFEPLKTKDGAACIKAFLHIIEQNAGKWGGDERFPTYCVSDNGFRGDLNSWLKGHGVTHLFTPSYRPMVLRRADEPLVPPCRARRVCKKQLPRLEK